VAYVEPRTNRLIGRDRELATLGAFLGEAVGDGATLLLTGEPGVGKTALLAAAAQMATTEGVRVIRGGGVEYETDVSFAGLHQLVDPLSDDLGRLPRSGRATIEVALGIGSGPAPDRLAVLSASLALFRQAASSTPLLIVIDDLHWLDRASGAAVGFVGRRLRDSRIGLLGAIRPGVGGFFERSGLSEFHVAPLVEADAMELLTRQFVHLPTRVRRGVVDEAQGNPLALLEFAALAGGSHDSARRHTTVTSGMSREVRTLYEARIERLPESTRRLLLLAVLDGSGGLGVLAAASGSGGLDELGPAERDHLIVVDDRNGEMKFRHPMIKSVVVERSTHDQRRAAHLRLAELFTDQPERRGDHLVRDPRLRFTLSHATSNVAGSQTRLNRSPKRVCSSRSAHRCSLVCHPSTRSSASFASSGAGDFTPDLPNGFSCRGPAVRLRHVDGLPARRLLRGLRHAPRPSAGIGRCRAATSSPARTGRFPRSP
jgi:predicted ATPase